MKGLSLGHAVGSDFEQAYTEGPFTIEGAARELVAHEEKGYEEWGASGSMADMATPIRTVPSIRTYRAASTWATSTGSIFGSSQCRVTVDQRSIS